MAMKVEGISADTVESNSQLENICPGIYIAEKDLPAGIYIVSVTSIYDTFSDIDDYFAIYSFRRDGDRWELEQGTQSYNIGEKVYFSFEPDQKLEIKFGEAQIIKYLSLSEGYLIDLPDYLFPGFYVAEKDLPSGRYMVSARSIYDTYKDIDDYIGLYKYQRNNEKKNWELMDGSWLYDLEEVTTFTIKKGERIEVKFGELNILMFTPSNDMPQ